jgi:hypothetical protein
MVLSPVGLGPEDDFAGDEQQQLQTTDPSSRQRGHPTSENYNCLTVTKIWSWTPNGGLILRQTGRMTVGRNIILTLTLLAVSPSGVK